MRRHERKTFTGRELHQQRLAIAKAAVAASPILAVGPLVVGHNIRFDDDGTPAWHVGTARPRLAVFKGANNAKAVDAAIPLLT